MEAYVRKVLAWRGSAVVLLAAAYEGGEFVFTHNMGAAASVEWFGEDGY